MEFDQKNADSWPKNLEFWPIEKLIPYSKNARKHSEEQICQIVKSIEQWGWTNPILIDTEGMIIAGHGRLEAAKHLGLEKVPCLILENLTPAQKKAYILADNKIALNSAWDIDFLKEELIDLKESDFDLSLCGFSEQEIMDLTFKDDQFNVLDEDKIPEPPKIPVTKPGDIWRLGDHVLICSDAQDFDWSKIGWKADLVLTDPPYNVNYEGKTKEKLTIKNDNLNDIDFINFLTKSFKNADEVLKEGGMFYIWYGYLQYAAFKESVESCCWKIHQNLIWKKSVPLFGRSDYQLQHEQCLYGWKEGAPHYWGSNRTQTTVLEFDKPTVNDLHPTMKPVLLFEYLIKNSTKPGGIVLDPFCGSGTSIIAAEKSNRKCAGIEIDPVYCDVIIERYEQLTGIKATKD